MIVRTTNLFDAWFKKLRDRQAKIKIRGRIDRATQGNLGDCRPINNNISEMRIDYGPGYRLYYTKQKEEIIILLVGGDKSTQQSDIVRAGNILKELMG